MSATNADAQVSADVSSPAAEAQSAGLSEAEAARRLAQYGENALSEHHVSVLERLAHFFWGPIPWMIEIAALLSGLLRHWADLAIILAMLFINAGVGFWQEFKADNAIALLKQRLALKARVLRDGKWKDIEARLLVPGDVVLVKLGNIIPADLKLIGGSYLSIDQAALTGESLPVDKKAGDDAYSGSIAKQGEMTGVVTATGMNTYFGKTAHLVEQAKSVSHFQRAVLRIGNFLILVTVGLVLVIGTAALFRRDPLLETLQFALILTVASIPVALPAVLSVTMAIGAERLASFKAIVSRLVAIEEMAGMDILCSDKTGTLTKNELTLGDIEPAPNVTPPDLMEAAALASRRDAPDAIDAAILARAPPAESLNAYKVKAFRPFDPVAKRAEADIEKGGQTFKVAKGRRRSSLICATLAPTNERRLALRSTAMAPRDIALWGWRAPTNQENGDFLDCCRCSIRRATTAPRRSRRSGRWAWTSRWSRAITKRSPGRSPANSSWVRILSSPIPSLDRAMRTSNCHGSSPPTGSPGSFPSTNSRSSRRCKARATSSA